MAGKVETCQVNKLLNFDRQLMKTLFNLRELLGGILINILTRSDEWWGQAGCKCRGSSGETGEFFCDDRGVDMGDKWKKKKRARPRASDNFNNLRSWNFCLCKPESNLFRGDFLVAKQRLAEEGFITGSSGRRENPGKVPTAAYMSPDTANASVAK